MPKQIATPIVGQPKKFPLRLPDDLALDLYAFCEATGAFHTRVICKAVRRYIDDELLANEGIRAQFGEQRVQLREKASKDSGGPAVIRLLKPKAEQSTGPKDPSNSSNGDIDPLPTQHKGD